MDDIITKEGTASQICRWLGVPDPSIRHVMNLLHARGLQQTSMGTLEESAPRYNTAQAFDFYYRITRQQLPPAAAQFLREALNSLRVAANREILAQAEALKIRQEAAERVARQREEEARQKAETKRADRAAAKKSRNEKAAQHSGTSTSPRQSPQEVAGKSPERIGAEEHAREHGLVTPWDIGERYGQLDRNGNLNPNFRAVLKRNGLVEADEFGRIKLFRKKDVDSAVQASKLLVEFKRTKKSWPGEDRKAGAGFWSIEAFLKDKMFAGKLVDPADYAEIERTLNTEYALVPIERLGDCKFYRLPDLKRAWGLYVTDSS